jgi:serine acetyltransferase
MIDSSLERADYMAPRGDVVIGHDVWIGADAIILPGVKIGDGAVIDAGAVVSRDVAAFQIVAGVPARPVRMRFSEALCNTIAASRWWERDYRELKPFIQRIYSQSAQGEQNIPETLGLLARSKRTASV